MIIEFKDKADKKAIFSLIGCYCVNPKTVLDEKYETNERDYPEKFHKLVWATIVNVVKKGGVTTITPLILEEEISLLSDDVNRIWNDNRGYEYIENAIERGKDEIQNIAKHRDDVRKYAIVRDAHDKLNITDLYDENDEAIMTRFLGSTSKDLERIIYDRYSDFKNSWNSRFSEGSSFIIGSKANEYLQNTRDQVDTWGYPFQSSYLTTVYGGMKKGKFIIRSSHSGGGKTRMAMGDMLNIAYNKLYDWKTRQWMSTGESEPVLFICTELSEMELTGMTMAHISGIDQERIEKRINITEEEDEILDETADIMANCKTMYGEYVPDYTIEAISQLIENHITKHEIEYCFFDYINDSPSLYSYYYEKTKTRLRTDQILYMFSNELKLLANRYNIYLGSSTQLNRGYKEEMNKDESALKGSSAIIDKADGGILALPVTSNEKKKIEPITQHMIGVPMPNMSYYIFKNRGGKWNKIIIWTKLDLGTMRETDCFVTSYDFELITDIEKTLTEFSFEDVNDCEMNEDWIKEAEQINGVEVAETLSNYKAE